MNGNFENIDRVISNLNSYKTKLASAIVDDKESVKTIVEKIDKIIEKLSDGNESMRSSKRTMDNKKKW